MALVELFISKDKYLARIDQLDVQLSRLETIRGDYEAHLNDLQNKVMTGEATSYEKMERSARQELEMLKVQIQNAQNCRAVLRKTVEQMDENQTLVEGVLDDVLNTTVNTVSAAKDASSVAATAAGIAALL